MQIQSRLSSLAISLLAALIIGGCSSTATEPVDQQEPVAPAPEVVAPVEVVEEAAPVLLQITPHQLIVLGNQSPERFTSNMTKPY